ncbi:MAG: sulfatase-like hydrolase/transferase [Deltaproteobacteria bacterium]|nr:sulfatase-like hydrolase/transferase [Deltaproteobacteria bacterium]MBN2672378.1 sulfatase-like hydrolase/transferase [Deltaproteobacteria bacterium]
MLAMVFTQMRECCALYLCLFFLSTTGCNVSSTEKTRVSDARPNIIIFVTDDQGYADVGAYEIRADIYTPNIDALAQNGVRMTNGYVTAPQCVPSRAAIVSGVYQQRFGVDDNEYGPLPLSVTTVGEHFQELGYRTGQVGKWDLDVTQNSFEWYSQMFPDQEISRDSYPQIPFELRSSYYPSKRGFDETFSGYLNNYWTTFDLDGQSQNPRWIVDTDYRVDVVSNAAVTFVERNHAVPFFLLVNHYAPHLPLEATPEKLALFSEELPERRRYALAAMASVDDGVGEVIEALRTYNIYDNTVIIFLSDNGAQIALTTPDTPASDTDNLWDGSLNEPLIGEKGMLTDGGIRIPYLIHWPTAFPAGEIVDEPVSSLDAIYTALKLAGASDAVLAQLDGVDLVPAIAGNGAYLNQRPLYWRFWRQSAVRVGDWKYISAGSEREYLFDMTAPEVARNNQLETQPEKAAELKLLLQNWEETLQRPADNRAMNDAEQGFYSVHVEENEAE